MTAYSLEEASARAGVEPAYLARLVEVGILSPEAPGRFSAGDVRRVLVVRSLEEAGISLDGLGAAIRNGTVSLDFMDTAAYERFAAKSSETFQQVSDRTGIPLDLLSVVREAIGLAPPSPDDWLSDDEILVVEFLAEQRAVGFTPAGMERLLRVQGEGVRRIAEEEGAWWASEVIRPALAAGKPSSEIANIELSDRLAPLSERAVLALYHAHQARVWATNVIEGFEQVLAQAGLYNRLERAPPAICFLDITGYTRLTQERGDDAAADLAAALARLVQRSSVQHGGKTIKWLGDGVMFYFRDPGPGVRAALEMVNGIAAAGLPPAHVGIHSGPVLFQQGDYFGQTVNLSARIADYARPGEVLVSKAVADASTEAGIGFDEIGPVELKGVTTLTHLLRARLT